MLTTLRIATVSFLLTSHAGAKEMDGGKVTIAGRAEAMCAFTASPVARNVSNMQLTAATAAQSIVSFTELIDRATARLKSASILLALSATCNGPHHIQLSAQRGMLTRDDPTAAPEAFVQTINYTAQLIWAGKEIRLAPGAVTTAAEVVPANTGELIISVDITAGSDGQAPVASGSYSDVLFIELSPAL